MSVYQLKTFLDILNAVCEEMKVQNTDTVTRNRIKRDINMVYLNEVVPYAQFKWLRGYADVTLNAKITTGTATVTQSSKTITLTNAPAYSVKGYWFSIEGKSERYQVAQHTANSATLTLETQYTGSTASSLSYSIWTDKLPLPSDLRDTIEVTQDFFSTPLEGVGIQKFRKLSNPNPKAEGNPEFYTTSDYIDPAPYSTISGLPSLSTRASNGLVKTLVFATSAVDYLKAGDRIEVSSAGDSSYNGRFIVSSVSTTTVTYTGLENTNESATADTSLVIKKFVSTSDDERYRELWVYPAVSTTKITLHVDYQRQALPLENDDDEPLMPIEDRIVLMYGALMKAWPRARNPEEGQRNAVLYDRKLAKMAGKLDDSTDHPVLKPSNLYMNAKRKGARFRESSFTSFGAPSGNSGTTPILGTANTVAIYDNSGELTGSTTITTTELNQLDGIQSDVVGISDTQTLSNKTLASPSLSGTTTAANVTVTGTLTLNNPIPIDSGGTNSSTALNNNRVMQSSGDAIVEAAAITASRALVSDADGIPTHATTTSTEIGYVNGVTSAIQTQIDGKVSGPASVTDGNIALFDGTTGKLVKESSKLPVALGGTNSSTSLNNNRVMQSSGGSIVEVSAITASRALVSDTNGIPTHATTTSTEIDYVSGVTSAIQTQIDTRQASASFSNWTSYTPTITGMGTVTSNAAFWSRVGDTLKVKGIFTTGTPTATASTISLPNSVTIDTAKLTATKTALLGHFIRATSGSSAFPNTSAGPFLISADNSSTGTVYLSNSVITTGSIVFEVTNGSNIATGSNTLSYYFEVPISGWSF